FLFALTAAEGFLASLGMTFSLQCCVLQEDDDANEMLTRTRDLHCHTGVHGHGANSIQHGRPAKRSTPAIAAGVHKRGTHRRSRSSPHAEELGWVEHDRSDECRAAPVQVA